MIKEILSSEPIAVNGILTSVEVIKAEGQERERIAYESGKDDGYNQALEDFSELVKSHLSIQGSFVSEDADTIKKQLKLK